MFDTSSSRTTVVVGCCVPPTGSGLGDRQETLTMVAEVDTRTHVIKDVSITVLSAISQRWLKDLIAGRDLTDEGDTLRLKLALEKFFLDPSREAVHSAYLDMVGRYAAHRGIIQRPSPVPEAEPD